jgi:hypothetical protein
MVLIAIPRNHLVHQGRYCHADDIRARPPPPTHMRIDKICFMMHVIDQLCNEKQILKCETS